ncbi:Panacea domain-containing protein [Pantanalinema sp. GBBB05]|uniref:Panacea domain-containing protein n=1 Tax=Pantanalinema sp. GBBB05 TaxID=2604139 RepID=UPI001D7154A5|nr:DUF4065 domain-containing protein [Pantanalinema sp. GBBB05]
MTEKNRLKELVHHICYKCGGKNELGATKLNKILWFADSLAYKQTGKSITGSRYKKLQHGPVPFEINSVLKELENEGKILVYKHEYFGLPKKTFLLLEHPLDEIFSRDELEFVDLLTAEICGGHTAKSISELSHDIVWEAASMGEEIPLSAVLATDEAILNEEDIAWANAVVSRIQAEGTAK